MRESRFTGATSTGDADSVALELSPRESGESPQRSQAAMTQRRWAIALDALNGLKEKSQIRRGYSHRASSQRTVESISRIRSSRRNKLQPKSPGMKPSMH